MLSSDQVTAFTDDGYVIIPNLLSPEETELWAMSRELIASCRRVEPVAPTEKAERLIWY